ncbi:MAG: efflux RND transporter periplasmic adaptor subunit [Pseudomonadota bacterium]
MRVGKKYLFRVGVLLWLIAAAAPASAQIASPVKVAKAEVRVLAPTTWVAGEVISRNDARIAAEIEGRLEWVADVGARLAKGGVIARIDATLIKEELAEYRAIIAREQARVDFLDQEVARLQTLVAQKSISQSLLDKTLADRLVARGDLTVAQAKANRATERLERTTIRAPFAGVVSERLLRAGEWADSGEPIVRMVDTASLEVSAWVTSTMLANVEEEAALRIKVDEREVDAKVRAVVRVGDNQSRMHELRLSAKDIPWTAGQAVRVAVPTAKAQPVLSVPSDALVLRRDGNAVFRVKPDNTAERVPVSTGIEAQQFIQILGAIQPGDLVVINGGERLRPGQSVNVVNKSELSL